MTATQTHPRVLRSADAAAIRSLVRRDPVLHCVLDARLGLAHDLDPQRLGGFLWGIDGNTDGSTACTDGDVAPGLRAAAFHGGNLIPIGEDAEALEAIATQLSRSGRGCSSIVGSAASVAVMWPVLLRRWGPARAVRANQPLMMIDAPSAIPPDPAVRRVELVELPRFFPAAVAMFTEELSVSPIAHDAGRGYRARVAELVSAGRAFARFDHRGEVEFKAEVGSVGGATAQIQGVWVRPDLRGRGIGTACMAAVLRQALAMAPSASLYVNDYNESARRMYSRLGMWQANVLTTVLF
ncbi:GNAT family N-acetyltransferase [Jatrophihabitans lederbergiae]|uniref:GNAT family N-acetyltransferase n=1 Tax=Jatrophihabitans lederbergiae TaxID=3075547 RepID=A0ABU2J4R8_9ACTN|nr:GNAT family N-acetyltransferase [Jatrophihabitans sp. DSM 44399]MDT0259979.1 GNAT family N-acetyltransferase [Jatrophihabitans sp. DSM 44399]